MILVASRDAQMMYYIACMYFLVGVGCICIEKFVASRKSDEKQRSRSGILGTRKL